MLYAVRVVLSFFLSLWQAWVGKMLWGWFVVSAFPGAPPITTMQAWGLVWTFSVFSGDYIMSGDAVANLSNNDEDSILWLRVVMAAFGPLLILVIGAIVRAIGMP